MFHAIQLRLVVMVLVVLSQATLSLLSVANVVIADLKGSLAALPIFIVATNASLSLATLAIVVLDYVQRSPLSVLSEIILCAAAGGIDLVSAIAVLFFKTSRALCELRSSSDFWNTCGADFAVVTLLWTVTFLLFAYAVGLFYAAKRYDVLHRLDEGSVWKQTVKETRWPRHTYSIDNPPGRRLRKRAPLNIESQPRVVQDGDSSTFSRQMDHASSSLLPITPSRSTVRHSGLGSPSVGFAERMGYLRRDAQGEYVPSTPTLLHGPQQGSTYRGPPEEVERGAIFSMQAMANHRRPSFPDLPNPFPPQPVSSSPILSTQHTTGVMTSNSSGNSSGSDSGFAGIGAGLGPQKDAVRISILMPSLPHSTGLPSTKFTMPPSSSELLGGGYQRPFRVTMPTTPTSAHSPALPRPSLQPSRSPATPASPQILQAGARLGYNSTHQHARSRPSLMAPTSTVSALEAAHKSNPLQSHQTRPGTGFSSSQMTSTRPALLQVPPAALSPSTKQRTSNPAYPLPLPPLSTYPIKSVAMSTGLTAQASQTHSTPEPTSSTDGAARRDTQGDERSKKDRPLSTASTISFYSTSSAPHGPQPSREHLPAASASSSSVSTGSDGMKSLAMQRSDSTSSKRSLKSKRAPTLARVPSHHGQVSQNLWGGTGNGSVRPSLATQFQRPQARPAS